MNEEVARILKSQIALHRREAEEAEAAARRFQESAAYHRAKAAEAEASLAATAKPPPTKSSR